MNKNGLKTILMFGCIFIACLTLQAQEKPFRDKKPGYQQNISVNYLLVDVIVKNGRNEYVRNLTRDDFVLFENGDRKEIISLDEYTMDLDRKQLATDLAESGLTIHQPPRNIIIFVDLFFSTPYGITQALRVTEDFVIDRIQPGDQVMLVSYFNGLRIIQPFTDDKKQIVRALRNSGLHSGERVAKMEAITGYSGAVQTINSNDAEVLDELVEAMEQNTEQTLYARHNARNYIHSLESLAQVIKQIRGRKTLIMLSGGINFELIDSSEADFAIPDYGGRRQGQPNYSSGMVLRGGSLAFQYRDAMEVLNDSSVSVYTVNTSGLEAPGGAQSQFSSKDTLTGDNSIDAGSDSIRKRQDFLSSLADNTGGRAYFNQNDIRSLLDDIEEDISNYYILGYRTEYDNENSERRDIRVDVKIPGTKVSHRNTIRTPVPFWNMNDEERDIHMIAGFLNGMRLNQLDAKVFPIMMPISADDLRLALAVSIPVSALEIHNDQYNMQCLLSVLDDNNNIRSSIHKKFIIPADSLSQNQQEINIVESLQAHEGVNRLRIVLRDNSNGSRSYFYFNTVQQKPELDSLVVTKPLFHREHTNPRIQQASGVTVEKHEKWNEGGTGADLLIHPELGPVFPMVNPAFKEGDTFYFMTQINKLSAGKNSIDSVQYVIAIAEQKQNHEEPELFRLKTDRLALVENRNGIGMSLFGEAKIVGWKPGVYELWVIVTDKETGIRATNQSALVVIE